MRHNPDKTDKSDGFLLSDLNRVGYLPEVWLAPEEIQDLRTMVRYRKLLARKKIGHLKSERSATHSQKDRPPCGKVPGCPSNRIWGGAYGQEKEPTGGSITDGECAAGTATV
ncbi:MAG: hypothetical protein ACKOPT_15400, partial [Cyanobium sp.]